MANDTVTKSGPMESPWTRAILGIALICAVSAFILYGSVTWLPDFIAGNQ